VVESISLYFHIPFCEKKCPYCHFFVLPNRASDRKSFQIALLQEWDLKLPLFKDLEIISLYFGGGTPFLHPEAIRAILDRASRLKLHPQVEITVEANPEQLTFEKLQAFKNMGVNRLSLGIQSLDDELLKLLGRTHTSQKGIQAVEMAYREGFDNLTIDLMYELPYQTLSTWKQTLSTLKTLPITHLSTSL
jgi:oxygen-independent coproporphyrinogen-3 oxidase